MDSFEGSKLLSVASVPKLLAGVIGLTIAYHVGLAIYNIYLHPLRHFPGPKLYAASRIPYMRDLVQGTLLSTINKAHEKYGDVIRVAPNELSFISGETAWQDIYGFRGAKKPEFGKDWQWYSVSPNGVRSMISATRADHSRQRRVFSHAFSDKALREQEPLIQTYIDLLIKRLHQKAEDGIKTDMVRYYNFTTFDIIGDLTFGESFGCLESDDYHAWVAGVFASLRALSFRLALRYFKTVEMIYMTFLPKERVQKSVDFFLFVKNKIHKRLAAETDRPDLITLFQNAPESREVTINELESTSSTLLIAGSETTATMLSGTTYLLLKTPEAMKKLVEEIRGTFKSEDEITIEKVSGLPYLLAVLNESLRIYPPVPTGFPRVVPQGGEMVSGHFVPEKTSVYMSQWTANRSSRNFAEPNSYIPERWLGKDPRFENDKKGVLSPFSAGPRNCIGKNLAYAEMRLILARMIWNFDLELCDEKKDWFDQKIFVLWEKDPLMVKLTAVNH